MKRRREWSPSHQPDAQRCGAGCCRGGSLGAGRTPCSTAASSPPARAPCLLLCASPSTCPTSLPSAHTAQLPGLRLRLRLRSRCYAP
eukprot:3284764-Rhodomonas_salina.1